MGNSASSGNNLVSTAVAASSDASLKLQLAEREAELEELRRRVAASEADRFHPAWIRTQGLERPTEPFRSAAPDLKP